MGGQVSFRAFCSWPPRYSACRNEHVFEHGCVQRITHPVHALLRQDDTHGTSSLRLQDIIQRGIEDRIQRGIEDLGDIYLRLLTL